MYHDNIEETVNQRKSRAERVREAKAAFEEPARGGRGRNGKAFGKGISGSYSGQGNYGDYGDKEEEMYLEEERKIPFGMLRMLAAGVLFLLLVTAFHYDVSWQGFNKAYVQQQMAEHGYWDALVNQVSAVFRYNNGSIDDK